MDEVVVVVGAGSIGPAIARRVGAGKHILLADLNEQTADAGAEVLRDAGSKRAPRAWMFEPPLGDCLDRDRHRRPSCESTCTALPWCWRSSARSSARAGRQSSSRLNPVTGCTP